MVANDFEAGVQRAMTLLKGINTQDNDFETGVQRAMQLIQNQNKGSETPQEFSWKDRFLKAAEGPAEVYGGLANLFGESASRVDEWSNTSRPSFHTSQANPNGTAMERRASLENIIAGESPYAEAPTDPTTLLKNDLNKYADQDLSLQNDSIGQFNKTAASIATPLPIPGGGLMEGIKWAAPIAGVAQVFKNMGMPPEWADLISSLLTPNYEALYKIPKGVYKEGNHYRKMTFNKDYETQMAKQAAMDETSELLKNKVGEHNIPTVIERIENYEPPFEGYQPPTADVAQNPGISQQYRTDLGKSPRLAEQHQSNMSLLKEKVDDMAPSPYGIQATKEHVNALQKDSEEAFEKFKAERLKDFDEVTATKLAELDAKKAALEAEMTAAQQQAISLEENALKAREQEVKSVAEISSAEDAGKSIQEFLNTKVKGVRKKASREVAPLYKEAYKSPEKLTTERASSYIKQEISKHSGAIKNDLQEALNAINAPKSETGDIVKQIETREAAIKEIKGYNKGQDNEKLLEQYLKANPEPQKALTDTERLKNAVNQIENMIEAVPPHERNRRRILTNVKNALEKDLSKSTKLAEADKVYAELIQPANIIEENPALERVIAKEKNSYTREFAMSQGDVPNAIIATSKDPAGAKELFNQIKNNRDLRNRVKHYINKMILDDFVGNDGKIKIDNFNRWKQTNKGAFELYPGLDKKLENLQEAQKAVDSIAKQNKEMLSSLEKRIANENKLAERKYQQEVKKEEKDVNVDITKKGLELENQHGGIDKLIMKSDDNKVINSILTGNNKFKKMEEAVKLAKTDKTGAALEGLKKAGVEHFKNSMPDEITFASFNRYLKNNGDALRSLYGEDAMKMFYLIRDALHKKHSVVNQAKALGGNSPTSANIETAAELTYEKIKRNMIGRWLSKVWGAKALYSAYDSAVDEGFRQLKNEQKRKIMEEVLLNPQKLKESLEYVPQKRKTFSDQIREIKPKFGQSLKALPRFGDDS